MVEFRFFEEEYWAALAAGKNFAESVALYFTQNADILVGTGESEQLVKTAVTGVCARGDDEFAALEITVPVATDTEGRPKFLTRAALTSRRAVGAVTASAKSVSAKPLAAVSETQREQDRAQGAGERRTTFAPAENRESAAGTQTAAEYIFDPPIAVTEDAQLRLCFRIDLPGFCGAARRDSAIKKILLGQMPLSASDFTFGPRVMDGFIEFEGNALVLTLAAYDANFANQSLRYLGQDELYIDTKSKADMSVMLTAVPTGRADFASGVPTALKNAAGKDIPYGFVLTPHTLTARELTQEEREFFALAKSGRLLLSSDRACLCAVTPHALEIYLTGGELRRAGRIQTRGEILACDLTGERIYLALYDASAGTQIVSYDLRQTCGGRTVCCKKSVYKSRARISLLRSAWAYGGDRLVFIEDGVLQCGIVGETGGFSPAWTKAAANADTLLTAAAAGSVLAFESGSKTFESVIMADLVTGETQSFILNGVNAVRSFADRGYFYDGAVLSVMNRAQNEGFVYYINMPSWRRMFEVDAVFFTADGYHAIFLTADGVLKYGLMDLQGTFTLQAQTQYSGEPPVAAIAAADMLLLLRADGGASAFTLDGTGGTLFYGGAEDELQAVLTAYSAPPKPFVLKSIRVSAGA